MARVKTRLRKNDVVQVIAGRENGWRVNGEDEALRGARGKILDMDRERGRAVVEDVQMVFKHQRLSQDPTAPNTGRIELPAPVPLSNLMLVCPKCNQPTRIGVRVEKGTDSQGHERRQTVRVCKRCNADIPERA